MTDIKYKTGESENEKIAFNNLEIRERERERGRGRKKYNLENGQKT